MEIETLGVDLPAKGQSGRASYTVRFKCGDTSVQAEFLVKVPIIRPYYKKYMRQIHDIEQEGRAELEGFLKRLLAKSGG